MRKTASILLTFLLLTLAAHPVNLRADPSLETPASDQPISVNFQNTDIDLVLKFFSDVTGNIFIKSDLVRGFVTVMSPGKVTSEEALEILQSVLDVKGFTMVRGTGKMIRVLAQSEAAQTELEVGIGNGEISSSGGERMLTQVVPLKFVPVQDLKNELAGLVSKGGNLIADERNNNLVITDMSSNIRRLLKMIAALDIRTPQVLIEALIMEVSLTKESKLGIEWSQKSSFHGEDHRFDQETSQSFDAGALITSGLKYSIIRDDNNFNMILRVLATDSNVNILSTPHIMTLNNQPANIRVGEEVPILTQTRNIQGGETIRSFDYKAVAVELEVTPRINADREVFMKVHPIIKKITGFNAELNAPILATREAQTSIIVNDGQTVVIGGLIKDDKAESQSKIPILGDIPLLGVLFRSRGVKKEKTELLVFITPRVVSNSKEAGELTKLKESEAKSKKTPSRLDAKTHYEFGRTLYRQKKYPEAIQEWGLTVELSPDKKLSTKAQRLIEKAKKKIR